MTGETTIPEKETEVLEVTLDEIENAIANLNFTIDVVLSAASSPKYRLTEEGAKKAAVAFEKGTGVALKSMTLLYGMMKQNGYDKIAETTTQNCVDNFCGYCQYYQPDKNTYVCTNKKSENFNVNTAPFQHCNCFSENKTHTAREVIKDESSS